MKRLVHIFGLRSSVEGKGARPSSFHGILLELVCAQDKTLQKKQYMCVCVCARARARVYRAVKIKVNLSKLSAIRHG